MTKKISKVPDFAIRNFYQPNKTTKFERVHKFDKSKPYEDFRESDSVLFDELQQPKAPITMSREHYAQKLPRTNNKPIKWDQGYHTKKDLTNFCQSPSTEKRRKHLKPALKSSSECFETTHLKNPNHYSFGKHVEKRSKPSKKVKWEDGYQADPSFEWYKQKHKHFDYPQADFYYPNYLQDENQPSFYQDDDYFDMYDPQVGYNNQGSYPEVGLCAPFEKYHVQNHGGHHYSYYPPEYQQYYPRYYGNHQNWLYNLQNRQEMPNPYKVYVKRYAVGDLDEKSKRKSFKNSVAQYDIISKVEDKKLQVSKSNSSSKIKKVGDNEEETKKEESSTKVAQTHAESRKISQSCSQDKRKENNTSTIISRFLLELTDKLRFGHGEDSKRHHLQEPKTVVNKDTQYDRMLYKKKQKFSTEKRKKISLANLFGGKKTYVKVLQNQSTQFEKIFNTPDEDTNTSSSTLEDFSEKSLKNEAQLKSIDNQRKKSLDKGEKDVRNKKRISFSDDDNEKKIVKKEKSPIITGSLENQSVARMKRRISNSELSQSENDYMEKYVVKLAKSDEEIVLYDVKPKFCKYLTTKGIKKRVVDKLMQKKM